MALYLAITNLSSKSFSPGGSFEAERILSVVIPIVAVGVVLVFGGRTLIPGRRIQENSPA